jgi:glutamate carboxypeptidase
MESRQQRIKCYLESHVEDLIEDLECLVRAQSSSTELESLDECAAELKKLLLNRLGGQVTLYPQKKAGSHLSWRRPEETGEHLLLIGHYDTVWPRDTIPLRREGNRLYGPGVLDMKSGIVSAIWAVKALSDLGITPGKRIIMGFNSDEELGSFTSQEVFASLAKGARAVLVCEPAGTEVNLVKTGRKGSGTYRVRFEGLSVHAGNDYWNGVNAIEQMARTIQYLHGLSDQASGTTVNVGVCRGGRKPNVVPDEAVIEVDTRYVTAAEQARTHRILMNLAASVPGAAIQTECISISPPMEETPCNLALFRAAREAGAELGLDIKRCVVGGASDGNYLSAEGIPTLDGLGAVGEGAHALHEQIYLEQWATRIAFLAELILRL